MSVRGIQFAASPSVESIPHAQGVFPLVTIRPQIANSVGHPTHEYVTSTMLRYPFQSRQFPQSNESKERISTKRVGVMAASQFR